MWMIKTAVRKYKQTAEDKQLGIAGLRRNGQLAAAPRGAPEPGAPEGDGEDSTAAKVGTGEVQARYFVKQSSEGHHSEHHSVLRQAELG